MECDYKNLEKKCTRKSNVGVCGSHKKYRNEVSVCDFIGRRKTMEDSYVINRNDEYELYGVFDGHGGKEASEFCREYFSDFDLESIDKNINKMAELFHQIILGLHSLSKGKVKESGTTASIILVYKLLNKMIVVNIGDSRVMALGQDDGGKDPDGVWSKIITKDHNINTNKKDLKSILEKGGKISEGENKYLMSKYGGVNLTRTIGDHDFKQLIRLPEIFIVDTKYIEKILISCDGLWEETNEEQIRNIIFKNKDLKKACKELVNTAYDDGSEDNITVMLINFTI